MLDKNIDASKIRTSVSRLYEKYIVGSVVYDSPYLPPVSIKPGEFGPPSSVSLLKGVPSLSELSNDLVFFTHGILMSFGNMPVDPVIEFSIRRGIGDDTIFYILTDDKMFDGMKEYGGMNFNHIICGMVKDRWYELEQWLDLIAGIDRSKKKYFRVLKQKLPVADVQKIKNKIIVSNECPKIDIYSYGIDGNWACIYLNPASNPPIDRPMVLFGEPEEGTKEIGAKLLNWSDKPLG